MRYRIHYDRASRYCVDFEADSPEEAIEAFWLAETEGENGDYEIETDSSGPTGLAMTDTTGRPIVWGEKVDLT